MQQKPLVLIVDDDLTMLDSMRAILEERFEVFTASTIAGARRLLSLTHDFSVACIDWRIPDGDGVTLCHEIRRLKPCCSCVLVTADASEIVHEIPDRDRLTIGSLRKPFRPDELLDRVTHYAGLSAMKRASATLARLNQKESKS